MALTRRQFLGSGAAAATLSVAPRAFAQWQPSQRYPDPAIQIVDQSFARYRLDLAKVERLATGFRWSEGPVWFGDGRYLLWSDIPNNRIMRWDEETGAVSVFRKPSNFANGNTRDRQGRLLTCEHGTRRVTRTEYDGTITAVADRFDGKPLNSPNDIVCKSDGSIWFTDPPFGILGFYEGYVAKPELPTNVYRVDGKTGQLAVATGDVNRPNGLAFSPDESKLYVVEAAVHAAHHPRRSTSSTAARGSPTSASSSTPGRARPTASAATWTATSGAAGAWARRASTASRSSTPTASSSAASTCPSAARTSASAARTATASSWPPARRSIRST